MPRPSEFALGWRAGFDAALDYLASNQPDLATPYDDEPTLIDAARDHRDAVARSLDQVFTRG